jgi:hypothetical protein
MPLRILNVVDPRRAAFLAWAGRVLLLCNGRLEDVALEKMNAEV